MFLGTYVSYRSGFTSTNSWIILMLLPVCIATTYFINYFLLNRFLIPGKYIKFILFSIYSLIVAFYLESLTLIFTFVYIAEFDSSEANFDTLFIVIGMLLPIVAGVAIKIFRIYLISGSFTEEEEKLTIRADRRNVQVDFNDILYIEGLKDYVKVYLSARKTLITKEKMMTFENLLKERRFARVHRSYIVCLTKIKSYNSKELEMIDGKVIPIGKTYKEDFSNKI